MDDTELLQVLDYLSTNNFILHNHKDDVRHMIRHIYGPDFDSSFSKIVMDYGQSSFLFPDDKARLKKVITTGAKLMRNVTKRERRLKRMNQHSKKKQDYLILLQNSYEPSLPVEDKKMLNKKIRNLIGYLRETLYFIDLEAAFIDRLKHGRKNRKAIADDVVPEVSREEKTTLWDILENRVKTATTVLDNFVKSHFQRSNQNEDQSDGNQNSQEAEIKVKTTELFDIVYPDFDKGHYKRKPQKQGRTENCISNCN